ncbi:hypothetical protein [Sphaerothrix gracilis]|uniref:hypothetical protein n=1 Tax=Sphaerothrix gracilis TaxID=3151835 RepID=UPI0031FE0C10
MKILFDQGTPVPLRRYLTSHTVDTAYERGWGKLSNGNLLTKAEQEGYELLITTDRNLRYEQNLTNCKIAIAVLMSTSWPRIKQQTVRIQAVIDAIQPGSYQEITIE